MEIKKEDLVELYVRQKLSAKKIMIKLNTSIDNVYKFLERYDLTRKNSDRKNHKIPKEELQKYTDDGLSQNEIAKIFKVNRSVIKRLLEKFEIRKKRLIDIITEDELIELYINQNLSEKEVSERLNVTSVIPLLTKYKINKPKHLALEVVSRNVQKKHNVTNISKIPWVKKKVQKTFETKHGGYTLQSKTLRKKVEDTLEEKTGVRNPQQHKPTRQKTEDTCVLKYGYRNVRKSDHAKKKSEESTLARFGVVHNSQSPIIKNKKIETRKANGTISYSGPEKEIFTFLKKIYPNTKRQYSSDKYPFQCDFYIPELDLYVEYQGYWTHGPAPFDSNNNRHAQKLEQWKTKNCEQYDSAIKTWTVTDPLKRQTATINNLNYLELWPKDYKKGKKYLLKLIKNCGTGLKPLF